MDAFVSEKNMEQTVPTGPTALGVGVGLTTLTRKLRAVKAGRKKDKGFVAFSWNAHFLYRTKVGMQLHGTATC